MDAGSRAGSGGGGGGMKARVTKCKGISGADLPTLEANINAWFGSAGEVTFLSAVYQSNQMSGEPYTCLIFYAE